MGEQFAVIRESFNDEKTRNAAIFHQQQQNRKELNHMIQQSNDIDVLRADLQTLKSGVEGHTGTVNFLHQEVSQWEHAIVAQQELRKEAAQLRTDINEIKENVAQIERE